MSEKISVRIKRKEARKSPFIMRKIRSTKNFVEDTTNSIFGKEEPNLPQLGYDECLEYIRKNSKTKVEFPVDSKSKEKLSKMLSPEVVGSAGGLIGAAATVGLIGSTLGTGLIIAGAGALIGGLIAKNSDDISWVMAELVILDEELVISGKFTLHFDEIKYVNVERTSSGELVVLTLKDKALAFRTYNAKALKTVIEEKMDKHYNK